MKSLSQSEYGELRSLYQQVYAPKFETILDEMTDQEVNELTEEIIEETVEEFFLECLEEGLDIGSVEETLCESLETSLMMLNEVSDSYYADAVKSGKAKAAKAKRAEMIGKVKGAVKKVGSALKSGAKAAYKGANRATGYVAGAAGRAASTAKSEFKKGYERGSKGSSSSSRDSGSSDSGSSSPSSSSSPSGSSSSGSTRRAVGGAVRKVGSLLKKGLKKAVGGAARAVSKGADKVATRLGEEAIQEADSIAAMRERAAKRRKQRYGASDTSRGGRDDFRPYTKADYERGEANDPRKKIEELYKGKHGQSDKEYADSRSQGGKMVSGDSKQSGAEYTHGRRVKAANPGMQPDVGGKTKPKSQGKMDRGTRADLEYRKANLKKEELELDQMIESLVERGYTEQEAYALVAQFTLDESQQARNNPEKYEREQSKKYAPVRGEKTPMPPRGDKRREDFEKWYAAQRR